MSDDSTGATSGAPTHRVRSTLSFVVGLIGVVGVLASILAVWSHRVLFDESTMTNAVEAALDEPEVVDGLAARLTDQVLEVVPVESLIDERIPSSLDSLTPVLVGTVQVAVDEAITRALNTEATRTLVTQAAQQAHRAAVRLLEGGSLVDGFTVEGGEVSLNLLPVLGKGLEAVQSMGLLSDVDVPELTRAGDPEQQISDLEEAFGRTLPDDFGQVVVYESDSVANAQASLARAQQAVSLFRTSIVVIIAVTLVCLVASLLLAVRRRRAAVILLLGVAAAMGVARAVVNAIVREAPTIALQPGARAAIRSMVTSLAANLLTAVTVTLVVGLVLALFAYLTGPSDAARGLRQRASAGGSNVASVIEAHPEGTAVTAFALAVVTVSLWGLGWMPLVVAAALVGLGVWALVGRRPAATRH